MALTYTCSVNPSIPAMAIENESYAILLLRAYGFGFKKDTNHIETRVFLYSNDLYEMPCGYFPVGSELKALAKSDSLADEIFTKAMAENVMAEDDPDFCWEAFISQHYPPEMIMQRLLRKPECVGITDLEIIGIKFNVVEIDSYRTWVTRITRESWQTELSHETLARMRMIKSFVDALNLVADMADGNIFEPDIESEETPCPVALEEHHRQKTALDCIRQFIEEQGGSSNKIASYQELSRKLNSR